MNEREAIVATADRIAQRMGGRFVLNEDRPMTDKPELKPCQTCGDDEPFIDSCGAFGRAWFAGTCGRCHYSTATFPTQADNMAFVLNHATLPDQHYCKFMRELEEDRQALGDHNG